MQPITPSSTDVTVTFRVLDATTFLPYESLTAASSGLALWYRKGATAALTALTESTLAATTTAHTDGGLIHIDDGIYRLDLPDAAIPTAEHEVTVYGGTATGYVILGGAIVGKPVEVVSGSLVAASVSGAVGSVTGHTPQTGDSFARIGAAGAGLTAVGDTSGTTTLLSRITALLQTKAEADTAHGLLATGANMATLAGYVDTEVAAIKAKTDNLPTDPADQSQVEAAITAAQGALAVLIAALNDIAGADVWAALDDASANKIADHVLRRSWATAAGSADGDALAFRSLLGAVAKLVNRVGISGATLTVYEDDDLTALGTQAVTSDAAAEPITGVNTV